MGEKINRILSWPVYVYLYGLAFIIFKIAAYPASFSLLPAINCLFLYCVGARVLLSLFRIIMNPAFAGFATVLVCSSFLHVVGIAQLLGFNYAYIPSWFYACFYVSVIVLVFFMIRMVRKIPITKVAKLNPMINVFLLIITFIFLTNCYRRNSQIKAEAISHIHNQLKSNVQFQQKDIVWILMDEYASSTSLQKQFGYQNPLDSILKKQKFITLDDMHTRFNNTLFSVNSIFNEDDSIKPSSYYEGIDLLRHSSLIPTIEKSGYRFVNLGFFDLAEHPMVADRSGYPYTFLQQLFSGTFFGMMYGNWKNTIIKADAYNNQIFRKLNDTISAISSKPRFIWAHMTIPHGPFCRDAAGQLRKDTTEEALDSVYIKRGYIGYLQYGNRLLVSLLNKHPEMSDKIIIISGDHGPRFPFLTKKEYQYWPFAAIHIPTMYDTLEMKNLKYISQLPGFLLKQIGKKG